MGKDFKYYKGKKEESEFGITKFPHEGKPVELSKSILSEFDDYVKENPNAVIVNQVQVNPDILRYFIKLHEEIESYRDSGNYLPKEIEKLI
jgi:hypothetical protein